MNKLVSILNYKTIGKQTSMLPVKFKINIGQLRADKSAISSTPTQVTIPKFTKCTYNSTYYLKDEIIIPITQDTLK